MARRSSPRRSSRKSARRSSRKAGPYALFVKKHYASAKRAAGKSAKPTTVFKKIAEMYRKQHHHGKRHSSKRM